MQMPMDRSKSAQEMAKGPSSPSELWGAGDYGLVASYATSVQASRLVRFAQVRPGQRVLDVGTGPGAVAIAAAQAGARATGVDPTPELLDAARDNARLAGLAEVAWHEGLAEKLPFPDSSFDVVLSEFGHMFSPEPEMAAREMLRVLRPEGRLAFSAWTPEGGAAEIFALAGRYAASPPQGPPPVLWGDPHVVRERLRDRLLDLRMRREYLVHPTMSPAHFRVLFEKHFGPVVWLVRGLAADPVRLDAWRREHDTVVARHFEDGAVRLEYLMVSGTKT